MLINEIQFTWVGDKGITSCLLFLFFKMWCDFAHDALLSQIMDLHCTQYPLFDADLLAGIPEKNDVHNLYSRIKFITNTYIIFWSK